MLSRKNIQNRDINPESKSGEPANKERREMFKRLGKYTAYTAPVVIAILVSEKGYAQPTPTPAPS